MRKILILLSIFLVSCSEGPGDLKGTWQASMLGIPVMTVTFTDDSEESMGFVQDVSYKRDGNDVYVIYDDGEKLHARIIDFDTIMIGDQKLKRIYK